MKQSLVNLADFEPRVGDILADVRYELDSAVFAVENTRRFSSETSACVAVRYKSLSSASRGLGWRSTATKWGDKEDGAKPIRQPRGRKAKPIRQPRRRIFSIPSFSHLFRQLG